MAGLILFSFISAFSPSVTVFAICRFVIGLFYPATMVGPNIVAGELASAKSRPFIGVLFGISFSVGLFLTGLKAYFVREWKTLIIICSAPYAVVLLFYW